MMIVMEKKTDVLFCDQRKTNYCQAPGKWYRIYFTYFRIPGIIFNYNVFKEKQHYQHKSVICFKLISNIGVDFIKFYF